MHVCLIVLSKTVWSNVSIPAELVEEIENRKPTYMSIAEFIRLSVRYYLDFRLEQNQTQKVEVPTVE